VDDFSAALRVYVDQLKGGRSDDAWFRLVEMGPRTLPTLMEAFGSSKDERVRERIVTVAAEYRAAEAVPFLSEALHAPEGRLWKAALDGLVNLGGEAALRVLQEARRPANDERRAWLDEAIAQVSGRG
jgi:hypothetical protein